MTIKILFVCTGNICRSPSAEGVFRHVVEQAGLTNMITIDSAGTHGYHIGETPDGRSQLAALQRGYDLSNQRARQISKADFIEFDYILAMDNANIEALEAWCPVECRHKLTLFLSYGSNLTETEVPDPYYGGSKGFENVLDLLENAAYGLLAKIK